jgi:hypothetical protein
MSANVARTNLWHQDLDKLAESLVADDRERAAELWLALERDPILSADRILLPRRVRERAGPVRVDEADSHFGDDLEPKQRHVAAARSRDDTISPQKSRTYCVFVFSTKSSPYRELAFGNGPPVLGIRRM